MALQTVTLVLDETWRLVSNTAGRLKVATESVDGALIVLADVAPAASYVGGQKDRQLDIASLETKAWARAAVKRAVITATRVVDAANYQEIVLGDLGLSAVSFASTILAGADVATVTGRVSGDSIKLLPVAGGLLEASTDNSKLVRGLGPISLKTPDVEIEIEQSHPLAANSPKRTRFAVNVTGSLTAGGGATRYSNSTDYYFAAIGPKWPNKAGTAQTGSTKAGIVTTLVAPILGVAAGATMILLFANHWSVEGNETVNEQLVPSDVTIEAVSVTYTDAGGTVRTAAATLLSNGGVLRADGTGGGVLVHITVVHAIPPLAELRIPQAYAGQDGFVLPVNYLAVGAKGEVLRKHATSSFASVVNAGLPMTNNTGSAAMSLGGQTGPCGIIAAGLDGRPVLYVDGSSLASAKGTPDGVTDPFRAMGDVEVPLARTTGGAYAIPCCNGAIAGSTAAITDPIDRTTGNANAAYNPNVQQHRRNLIRQVTVLNGGRPPFTHLVCERVNNELTSDLASFVARMKTRYAWLRAEWPGLPIIQTTHPQKVTSTDGFRTYGGQTPSADIRFEFYDKLFGDKIDGSVDFAVDIYSPVAFGTSTEERRRFAVAAFTTQTTRAVTAGDTVIHLAAAPALGAALSLDPLSGSGVTRIVTDVQTVTAGAEYQVTTTGGASSGTYPAKASGTLVGETLVSDGISNTGLHLSKAANDRIAADTGPRSWYALKAALKAAVGGAWAA